MLDKIWIEERQVIRDNLIKALKENKLNEIQKKQLLEIVMSIDKATDLQKERFVLYYGLDGNQGKCSISEIAKLQKCSYPGIRLSVNKIESRLIRVSDDKIEILKQIVNKISW